VDEVVDEAMDGVEAVVAIRAQGGDVMGEQRVDLGGIGGFEDLTRVAHGFWRLITLETA
jgi:hypothetical protein